MRWIVETSLRYRYLVIFLAVVLMIAGVARLRNSAVDVFPEFAPPRVEIQTLSMGLSATDVEEIIASQQAEIAAMQARLKILREGADPSPGGFPACGRRRRSGAGSRRNAGFAPASTAGS